MDRVLQTSDPSSIDRSSLLVTCKTPFFRLQSCFFENGSQCSHPYLWTAHIPKIGTNTRHHPMMPKSHGLFSTHAAKCPILCIMLDNPNWLFVPFCGLAPRALHGRYKEKYELGKNHQYTEDHLQSSKTPLLRLSEQNVIDQH